MTRNADWFRSGNKCILLNQQNAKNQLIVLVDKEKHLTDSGMHL